MVRRSRRRRGRGRRDVGLGGVLLFLLAAVAATALAWWLYSGVLPGAEWVRGLSGGAGTPGGGTLGELAEPPVAPEVSGGGVARQPSSSAGVYPTEPEVPAEAGLSDAAPVPVAAPEEGAYVAVVIDDLGRSLEDVRSLADLGVPLSYAVLPFETRTPEVVEELHRQRAEILLHLPMEGREGADPGPGALRLTMPDREMLTATRAALAAVPGAVGFNNHMGSVLSADGPSMDLVLRELGGRGLFFLDSRTTADSVGYLVARERGIPAAKRDVFLDPDLDPEAIRSQFHRLLDLARREGSAIAIGHPHPATLEILGEEVPRARRLGYRFVPVSDLLDRNALPE